MRVPLLAACLLAICSHAQATEQALPHWGYQGANAPEHWGTLSPHFSLCHFGQHQSPIDIRQAQIAPHTPLQLFTYPSPQRVVNNGHTVEILTDPGTWLMLDGLQYALQQFHFHTPAENTLDGQRAPMEGHFVFSQGSSLVVVAVMYALGNHNDALDPFIEDVEDASQTALPLSPLVNLRHLMPSTLRYYRFTGSLTTPPCTEGVTWLVLQTPVSLSSQQLKAFREAIGQVNTRPVQPLHQRIVTTE